MSKHHAKRIDAGVYEYRDHLIEEVGRYDGNGAAVWNITHKDENAAHDAANTLRDAKALIDHWATHAKEKTK